MHVWDVRQEGNVTKEIAEKQNRQRRSQWRKRNRVQVEEEGPDEGRRFPKEMVSHSAATGLEKLGGP